MTKRHSGTPQSPDNQKDADAVAFAQGLFELARNGAAGLLVPLLGAGVPVDLRTSEGETLLLLATANNHPKTVQMLLDQGANPNLADNQGRTPLMRAAEQDLDELVQALLAAGADASARDGQGQTALTLAEAAGADRARQALTSA